MKIDVITKKWWFYLLLFLSYFIIPPYTEKPISSQEIPLLIQSVLSNPYIYQYTTFWIISKVTLLALVISFVFLKNRIRKVFAIYAFVFYVATALFQNSATTNYGFTILFGNVILQILVALFWLREVFNTENDFNYINNYKTRFWIFPLMMLAFWFPTNELIQPAFYLNDILTNQAGLTYCMVTPVIIGLMIFIYPNLNIALFRINCFVGLLFGMVNMVTWFVLSPQYWWMGILHLPLFIIAVYGLVLQYTKRSTNSNVS